MQSLSLFPVASALFALALGLPVVMCAVLVRERRRVLGEIRTSAGEHSWSFSVKRAFRDPAEFAIRGETFGGLPWHLRTSQTRHDQDCKLRLELTFPTLGGECNLAVVPRDPKLNSAMAHRGLEELREAATGVPDFDAAFKILVLSRQTSASPLQAAIAARFLSWPRNTVTPRSVAAWRDDSGCHLEAQLPAMANWATIEYLVALGEDFCATLPAPSFFNSSWHKPQLA